MAEFNPSTSQPPPPPGWDASRALTARILLWFELLALAIGAAQFVVANSNFTHRWLAIVALAALLSMAILGRTVPRLRRTPNLRAYCDSAVLLLACIAFIYATDGAKSPVLPLFLLPLTGAAVALGRWGYGLVALLVSAAAVLVGGVTPEIGSSGSSLAVWLIGTLVPPIIATTAIAILVEQMQGAERYIQDLRSTDRLTGLLNRRALEEVLSREHRKSERHGHPYCVLMIDVENIKQLNEAYGHDAGNQLLTAVAAAISRSIRATDVAARFGGDEFAVLLIDTDLAIGTTIGNRIRSHVYAGTISVANRLVRANVHIGLACFPKDKRAYKDLLVLADQRMQQDRELHRTGK